MVIDPETINKSLSILTADALNGGDNPLSPLVDNAFNQAKTRVTNNAVRNGQNINDPIVQSNLDKEARKYVNEKYLPTLKKSVASGEMSPDEKEELANSGLGLIGVGGGGSLTGIILKALFNTKSYVGMYLSAAKEYLFGEKNGTSKSWTSILEEKKLQRSLNNFAEEHKIDPEQLMAAIQNPPQEITKMANSFTPEEKQDDGKTVKHRKDDAPPVSAGADNPLSMNEKEQKPSNSSTNSAESGIKEAGRTLTKVGMYRIENASHADNKTPQSTTYNIPTAKSPSVA